MPRNRGRKKPPGDESSMIVEPGAGVKPSAGPPSGSQRGRTSRPGSAASRGSARSSYVITNPGFTEMPHPVLSTPSGAKIANTPWVDPFATGRPLLWGKVELSQSQPSGIKGFGTVLPGENLFNFWQARLADMVHAKAASSGLSITNYNATGTINVTMQAILGDLMDAIRMMFGLRCLSKLYGYNQACSAVATAVNLRIPDIDARINRLRAFYLPKQLVDGVKKTAGVWITGRDSDAPYFTLFAGVTSAQMDLSLVANIDNILTAFDAIMTAIAALPAADVSNLFRVFSQLYAPIDIGEGAIVQNEQEYCMHTQAGVCYGDATIFTAPCLTGMTSSPLVPTLVYGDPTSLDEHWLTYTRGPIVASDTGVAAAAFHWVGMFDTFTGVAATRGSNYIRYVAGPGFQEIGGTELTGVGVKTITAGTGIAFDAVWAPLAMREIAAAGQLLNANDNRALNAWSLYYVPLQVYANNTIVQWHDWFEL